MSETTRAHEIVEQQPVKSKGRMKQEVKDYIDQAAKSAAEQVLEGQRAQHQTDYYRAMESLLFNYKALAALVADEESYMEIDTRERSKSITVAPPPGQMFKDRGEVMDDMLRSRAASFRETRARFESIDRLVRLFAELPEFVVIRMYYFGEDAFGQPRDPGVGRYTWSEIADALALAGMARTERTVRSWRTQIVSDMAVCMFGTRAALSIQTRREPKPA